MRELLSKILWRVYCLIAPKEDLLYRQGKKSFMENIMDPDFPWKQYDKEVNPYFAQWGFKFSRLESEFYSQCTGIKSDLYIPMMLYKKYIYPYLNNDEWRWGFVDKNMISRLLDIQNTKKNVDVILPECIVSCVNGRFFLNGKTLSTKQSSIETIMECSEDLIIKPSTRSSHGKGVMKVNANMCFKEIYRLFDDYGDNFVVQKIVSQHPDLAVYNPTSVNTIRITTYQNFKGEVKILYSSQRFGGKGKIYDNADDPNGSGGFCAIRPDGTVSRIVHHYRKLDTDMLDENIPAKVPFFDKIKDAVLYMHTLLPQYAFIGWDMSVTPDGHPVVIEYNFRPGLGTGQLAHGPIFEKQDLDEIMERISKARLRYTRKLSITYPDKPGYGL